MAEQRSPDPSQWWWVLSVLVGIIGGLIAWGILKEKYPYIGKSHLLVGGLSTGVYVLSVLL